MTSETGFLIVGSPRSGTTLVQRLTSEVTGAPMPPETHFFDLFVPAALTRGAPPWDAERLRSEVAAWAAMPQLAGVEVDVEAVVSRCGGRCASFSQLFDAVVATLVPTATTAGEKTPHHGLWWEPIATAMPRLRFIVVVRSPCDVVASNLKAPWAASLVGPEWGDDVYLAAAEFWRAEQVQSLRLLAALPERSLLLRYEEVVAAPADAKLRIATFLGIPIRPAADPADADLMQYVLGRETWKQQVSGPITTSRIDAGAAELGPSRAALVSLLTRREARALGYRLPLRRILLAAGGIGALHLQTVRRLRGLRAWNAIHAAERSAVRL